MTEIPGAEHAGERLMNPILPHIKGQKLELHHHQWTLKFYDEFEGLLYDEKGELDLDLLRDLERLSVSGFEDFRQQVIVKGTPLLLAVFNQEKEFCFYSPRLSRELFIIEQVEVNKENDLLKDFHSSSEYQDFKIYAEKVASLSSGTFPTVYDVTTNKYKLSELTQDKFYQDLEQDIETLSKSLRNHLNQYQPSFFERVSDFGLDLTAQFALLRIHLLKFLAILPSLDHDEKGHEVKRILMESLRRLLQDSSKARKLKRRGQNRPLPRSYALIFKIVLFIAGLIPAGVLAFGVRSAVRFMAKRFIAGESIDTVEESFSGLFSTGRDVTLDQLGELVVSEKEADNYCFEVIKLVRGFGQHVKKGEKNKAGINRAHVSIKVSALCSDFKPYAPEYTYEHVSPRLKKILLAAKEHDVFINIDAEHYDYRDIVFKVYKRVLLETPELKDYQQTGIVLQAYLRDAYEHFEDIVALAKERGLRMPIRLVKGAYWDAETVEADAHSFNAPEFLNKEETDLHFRQLVEEILKHHEDVQLCLASHNFADHCFAEILKEKRYPEHPAIEHQCLHMTYEALSMGLAKMGWPTRNYVPVGSLLVGMAYLVRRIMENSSQVGVLTIMRSHKKAGKLLSPMEVHLDKRSKGKIYRDMTQVNLTSEFFNITPLRLYLDKERESLQNSLAFFKEVGLGQNYSNSFLVNGEIQHIVSSSSPETIVGEIQFADSSDATKALELSHKAYNSGTWAKTHWLSRASIFLKTADLMLAKRNELSALIVYEAGKSVNEALADVDEAVDFLNFYAREERKISVHGKYMQSRGVIVSITPWNFPLAIPTGMVCAPLVAGNTVILKSAEQTPLIAQKIVDIFHEAGVPKDVLIHLPGMGETVGDTLVSSPKCAGVVFTGSKAVGTMIANKVNKRLYKNELFDVTYPSKAITEMGGKNAVIVTANAELDETVAGILYSAFAHAGQKCSAASRVIVDASVKERLIERLSEAIKDMEVSEAFNFSCAVNPVITKDDQKRLREQVALASKEAKEHGGRVVIDRSNEDLPGFCVGPSLIELPAKRAMENESWAKTELFGPVVHIIGFHGLDCALEIFNCTDYALTGGVFSQSQDDIDYLSSKMECGNLYINRTITGARVAIEPFGGFKLSGTGPKAGGKGYLPSFHLNLQQDLEEGEELETGSDYNFDLCRPSNLRVRHRGLKLNKGIDIFLHHFESMYQGIHGEEKKLIQKYQKWASKNLETFVSKEHSNRKIPGQISYNDFNLSGEHLLVVSHMEKPHISSILYVLSALAMGTGVTVAARTERSYGWWSTFLNYFRQAGFGKENFDVFFSSDQQMIKTFESPKLGFVLADGDENFVKDIASQLFEHSKDEVRMRHLLSGMDIPNKTDFKRFCSQFVWVRAFAVNTMRHGAPLDLEI